MNPITIFRNARARRRTLAAMGIRPGDLVLEVGSGQNPNPRADVLCDRYLVDDTERNREAVILDRPFVVGDIHHLPFRTGAFDFVICAHVLEHLEDPAAAAGELSRVARRGYVEVPSRENELLLPFPFHRWLIDREGDTLVFRTKERPVPDPGLRRWFTNLSRVAPGFADLFLRELHALGSVHGVRWETAIALRVDGPPGRVEAESRAPERDEEIALLARYLAEASNAPLRRRFLDALTLGRWPSRRTRAVDPGLLACPRCGGGPLEGVGGGNAEREAMEGTRWSNQLRCAGCEARYPVLAGSGAQIPWLVR